MTRPGARKVLLPYREPSRVGPYRDALLAAGLDHEPALTDRPLSMNGFNGLLLMGGTDVDPALYNESRYPETQQPDRERDDIELALLNEALARDIPILAICRGLQILNVFHGGSLIQHLPEAERHQKVDGDRSQSVHEIRISPDTALAGIAGSDRWLVNSRHHQAVKQLGAFLQVSAVSCEDGVMEAIERPDRQFVVAVQWHPEDQINRYPEQLELFKSFRSAVEKNNE